MHVSEFQKTLKTSTQKEHTEAENHPIMQSFIKGTFEKKNLLRFLCNVRSLYYVVEQRLLQPYILYNNELLRTPSIEKDIQLLCSDFSKEELEKYLTPYEVTDLWVAWCWSKPNDFLVADLYVRWLADLYGGRIMSKSLGQYNNTTTFENPSKAIEDIRTIIDKPLSVSDTEELVQEAKNSFTFHIDLFNAIQSDE